MNAQKKSRKRKISAEALREFADNRRIANKAVRKAIEENRKLGVSDDYQFAK